MYAQILIEQSLNINSINPNLSVYAIDQSHEANEVRYVMISSIYFYNQAHGSYQLPVA